MAEREPVTRGWTCHLRRWAPLGLLVAVGLAAHQAGLHHYLSFEAVARHQEWLEATVERHYLSSLAVFAAVYVLTVAISAPFGVLLTLVGGYLFGWMIGAGVSALAATAGATLLFLAARSTFADVLAARAGRWIASLRDGFARDGFYYLLFLRLVPAFPFWLVNIAPALLGMDLPRYVLATAIGVVPGTIAFSLAGAGLGSVIEAQMEPYEDCVRRAGAEDRCDFVLDPHAILTPELVAALVALGIIALIPILVRRWRGARPA